MKPAQGVGGWGPKGVLARSADATNLVATLDELYGDLLARCLVQRKLYEAECAAVQVPNLQHAYTRVRPLYVPPDREGHDRGAAQAGCRARLLVLWMIAAERLLGTHYLRRHVRLRAVR